MSSPDWRDQARALLTNGYLIVPIRPGAKSPAIAAWQSARLGAADLETFRHHGVGVLTGQGAYPLAVFDIDVLDEDLGLEFLEYLRVTLGPGAERIGRAPKSMMVYRAAEDGWGKAASSWFEDPNAAEGAPRSRLEILGKGQQFVAYHIHPETGRPYVWTDLFGGIEETHAAELPVVTAEQCNAALAFFEAAALRHGMRRAQGSKPRIPGMTQPDAQADPLMAYEPPVGLEHAQVQRLLEYVDNADYDTWFKVGASLHHEYGGDVAALDLWDEWSRSADNYQGFDDLAKRWASFGLNDRAPITARWLMKAGRTAEREALHQAKRDALEGVRLEIEACNDSILLVNTVGRSAGEAAGDDLALRAELAGLLRARFKALTGTVLPIADVRAAMSVARLLAVAKRDAGPGRRERRQSTEFGLAERMLDAYGEGLMFVPELALWYTWTGVYWRPALAGTLEHLAKETVRALLTEAAAIESSEERQAFVAFFQKSQRAMTVTNMISLASSDPRVVVPVAELDRHSHLLGVGNGVVDLRTGKLRQATHADRITTVTPVAYSEAATCPLFDETLLEVMDDDEDLATFFMRLIGYCLMGNPREDVLPILFGSGSNGKSTLMEVIREAFGGYAASAAAATFLSDGSGKSNAGGAREDLLRLRGKRLVHVGEPDEGAELKEGLVKSMTGGDAIPARGMYSKTTIEVTPTWVAIMPTNHRPIVKGDDHAIWRRILLVPFTRNFDADLTVTKDPDRAEKLRAELPGILRRIVVGGLDYLARGLARPKVVDESHKDYRQNMDLLAEWIEACCELDPNGRETTATLWASWSAWAGQRGELRFIANSRSLGRRLSARFASWMNGKGARGFVGIRLKNIAD